MQKKKRKNTRKTKIERRKKITKKYERKIRKPVKKN